MIILFLELSIETSTNYGVIPVVLGPLIVLSAWILRLDM